jgi:hypothetical protein
MMEAPITSRRYIPEGCHVHIRSRENLKRHNLLLSTTLLMALDFTCGLHDASVLICSD